MPRFGMLLPMTSTVGRLAIYASLLAVVCFLPSCQRRFGSSGAVAGNDMDRPTTAPVASSGPVDTDEGRKFLSENFAVDSADGLTRLKYHQPMLAVFPPGQNANSANGGLEMMGKVTARPAKVVECNAIRKKVVVDWVFSQRQSNWPGLTDRYVRWTHVFYPDGRRVTTVELNNAGGLPIATAIVDAAVNVAWSDGLTATTRIDANIPAGVGRWSFLSVDMPTDVHSAIAMRNYSRPPTIELLSGQLDDFSPGDVDKDRFDQVEGFYYLRTRNGRCAFRLTPPEGGVLNPIFFVSCDKSVQPGQTPVINVDGVVMKNVVLIDGGAMFEIPGQLLNSTSVEIGWGG